MKKKVNIGKKTMMNKFDIFLQIEDERWNEVLVSPEELVIKCKDALLACLKDEVSFLSKPKNFSINLLLSNDETVHRLNKEFRGFDKPTNVLSFANIDDADFVNELDKQEDIELGDVILAYETVIKESEETEETIINHFCHLWIHGMLHILGYDHIIESDRLQMEKKEIEILALLHIHNPYQE